MNPQEFFFCFAEGLEEKWNNFELKIELKQIELHFFPLIDF